MESTINKIKSYLEEVKNPDENILIGMCGDDYESALYVFDNVELSSSGEMYFEAIICISNCQGA